MRCAIRDLSEAGAQPTPPTEHWIKSTDDRAVQKVESLFVVYGLVMG